MASSCGNIYKVSLKMATEEYYSLKSKARLAGISLSEYVRQTIKKSEVKQRLSPEHLGYVVNTDE